MSVKLSPKAYYWLMAVHRGLDHDEEVETVLVDLGGDCGVYTSVPFEDIFFCPWWFEL